MQYVVEQMPDRRAVVHISGRLDATMADELKQNLKGTIAEGNVFLVIDLSGVYFIDSSGLSALVSGFKSAQKHHGTLVLANVGSQVQVALELTQLNRIFGMYEDIETALASLGDQAG